MRKYRATGFTLVEIVVVLAIVALLAAIIVPVFSTSGRRVNQQTCMNNLHTIGVNLTQYWQDYGQYPKAPAPTYLHTTDPKFVPFEYLPTEWKTDPEQSDPAFNDGPVPDKDSHYTGDDPLNYSVEIKITYDGTSIDDPDQFIWSEDPPVAPDYTRKVWYGPFAVPTGSEEYFDMHKGLRVLFGNALAYTTADAWSIAPVIKLPENWKQWMPARDAGVYAEIDGNQAAETTIFPVKTRAQAEDLQRYLNAENGRAYVDIINTDGRRQASVIKDVDVDTQTVTLYDRYALTSPFLDGSKVQPGYIETAATEDDFISGNFGLARLLGVYGISKKLFHCPQIETTRDVQIDANLRAATEGVGYARNMRFDTLLSGYNTYDVTYNYDQYDNAIRYFDTRLGFGSMNASRQLQEKYPPADTIVCWCYGHRPDQTPAYDLGDPDAEDYLGAEFDPAKLNEPQYFKDYQNREAALITNAAKRINGGVLVLWLDGSVEMVKPYLVRGKYDRVDAPNRHYAEYYWVPPFLYSRGDWQK